MQIITVQYNNRPYKCRQYSPEDESNIRAIVPAWLAYINAVEGIGKSPQVSSAFSQAFCYCRLQLVETIGYGVDAFKINKNGRVLRKVEIKATCTPEGRNDIRMYPKAVTGRE